MAKLPERALPEGAQFFRLGALGPMIQSAAVNLNSVHVQVCDQTKANAPLLVITGDDFIILQMKRALHELRLKNRVVRLQSAAEAIMEIKRTFALKSANRLFAVVLDLSVPDFQRLLAWYESNPKHCPALIGLQNAFDHCQIEQWSHLGVAALLALPIKAADVAAALSLIQNSSSSVSLTLRLSQ